MKKNKIEVRLKRGDDFLLVHLPFYKSVEKEEATVYELEYTGDSDIADDILGATIKHLKKKGVLKQGLDIELTIVE